MSDDLKVTFWGTRGSIPTPGRLTEKYGGNTTCVEVRCGDELIILDAGSGIRELGMSLLDRSKGQPIQASLLFTHLHWDHIQGFPFFPCAYIPSTKLTIYGEERASGGIRELLSGQMGGDYFPINLGEMAAQLEFHAPDDEFQIGQVRITTFQLPHPGGALGYRFETGDSVFVFATDCELDTVALNQEEVQSDHLARRKYSDEVLQFFEDAHLIVIDCQYTDEVYRERVGWGHNSLAAVVDLCEQVEPGMVALFHHDPQSTDDLVTQMVDDAASRLNRKGLQVLAFGAREGLTVKATRPKPSPVILGGS